MKLTLSNGQSLEFSDLETTRPTMPPRFVLSIRKSGSTMITFAAQLIAEAYGVGFRDVGGILFHGNAPDGVLSGDPAVNGMLRPGVIFSGFRDYPSIMEQSPLFASARKVILIRDPRDALVSEYFSNAYSHSIPEPENPDADATFNRDLMVKLRADALQAEVNEYVLRRAPDFEHTCAKFYAALKQPEVKVFKYEDIIFDKVGLVQGMCDHLEIPLSAEKVEEIARWLHIIPEKEKPTEFVRKVIPGDYREKLSDDTIEKLNKSLDGVLYNFGYTDNMH